MGLDETDYLCWLSLVCVGLIDREKFQLFSSQVLWEEESATIFKCQTKQVKGDHSQEVLHVVYRLEHVLTFIAQCVIKGQKSRL